MLTVKHNLSAQAVPYFHNGRFWTSDELKTNLQDVALWFEYAAMFRTNKIVFSVGEYWDFPNTHWETIRMINSAVEEEHDSR